MQTQTITRPKSIRRPSRRLRPDDFRRLGLGPTESRVTVIRRATANLATSLANDPDPEKQEWNERELALVLTSAYRLLDPRRRDQLAERVQLLRAEPSPLRSHLLQPDSGLSSASQRPSLVEFDDDESGENDWMLDALAELRVESSSRSRLSQSKTNGKRRKNPTADQAQLLEIARFLNAKRRFKSVATWIGGLILLAIGAALIIAASWMAGRDTSLKAEFPAVDQRLNRAATDLEASSQNPIPQPIQPATEPTTQPAIESTLQPAIGDDIFADEAEPDMLANELSSGGSGSTDTESDLSGVSDAHSSAEVSPKPQMSLEGPRAEQVTELVDTESWVLPVLPVPADQLLAPVRHPLPSPEELDEAIRKAATLRLADGAQFPIGTSTVVELWKRSRQMVSGTKDQLAVALLAGQRAVLLGNYSLASVIASNMSLEFDATPEQLSTVILSGAASDAVTLVEQERVIYWSLITGDAAFASDQFVVASEAGRIGSAVGAKHGDVDLRNRLKQQREAGTIAERVAKSLNESPDARPETSDKSFCWNVGRHLCINRRDWVQGLVWLSAASDARFAALASEESLLADKLDAAQLAGLARRWLEFADRRKGREVESIRLHAIDLLRQAAAKATALEKLELEKEASTLADSLPADLQPLDLAAARELLAIGNATTSSPVPAARIETPSSPESLGLIGRLAVSGADTGIIVQYPTHIPLPRAAVDQVLVRANLQPGPISIELQGYVEVPSDTTVRLVATGPVADTTPGIEAGMVLSIDGLPVLLDGQGPTRSARMDMRGGVHRVVWKVSGDKYEPTSLVLTDDRDGQVLHLRHDSVTELALRQLPVRLKVDFQSR